VAGEQSGCGVYLVAPEVKNDTDRHFTMRIMSFLSFMSHLRSCRTLRLFVSFARTILSVCALAKREGVIWREAKGIEDEVCGSHGDPTSNAESMALLRAAAKFGLGLNLYER